MKKCRLHFLFLVPLLVLVAEAAAQSLIFQDGFESGRLCGWSEPSCDLGDLLQLPIDAVEAATILMGNSSCEPPSADSETMTNLVAMAMLQKSFRTDDAFPYFIEQYPADDLDGDRFSLLPDLEPAPFRGKDCDDGDGTIHPLLAGDGRESDINCNGIYGVDSSKGVLYEDLFCRTFANDRNLLVFGDAMASGFHMDVGCLEGDFPTCMGPGAGTLYNFPWLSFLTGSEVESSLQFERHQRNRCVHRQWMNFAVPDNKMERFTGQVSRYNLPPADAKPSLVVVFFGLEDVCVNQIAEMTNPVDFMDQLLAGLTELDSGLAPDSKVILMGLYNFIFPRDGGDIVHPASPESPPSEVFTYGDAWDYLSCLGVNACPIITSTDPNHFNSATQRALELDSVLQNVSQNYSFTNFQSIFLDFDELHRDAAENMANAGLDPDLLFMSFDGLLPRLEYAGYLGEALLSIMDQRFPGFLAGENPANASIEAIFGDQGGH